MLSPSPLFCQPSSELFFWTQQALALLSLCVRLCGTFLPVEQETTYKGVVNNFGVSHAVCPAPDVQVVRCNYISEPRLLVS